MLNGDCGKVEQTTGQRHQMVRPEESWIYKAQGFLGSDVVEAQVLSALTNEVRDSEVAFVEGVILQVESAFEIYC